MPDKVDKIILTDWPKLKYIEANMRGVTTEKLIALREDLFHLMMVMHTEEAGGYYISYHYKAVEDELKYRKCLT